MIAALTDAWALLPTDPGFWVVAVSAALLLGLGKSGFAAGFAALSTPLLALRMPVPEAAALMLPLLAMADAVGVFKLAREAEWGHLAKLLPAGLLGVLLGWVSFGWLSREFVSGTVGLVTLLFLAQQVFFPLKADAPPPGKIAGGLLGAAAGYTSFVANAGAPPMTAYLLPLRLAPMRYTGTFALFFTCINLSKWPLYGSLGLFHARGLMTSVVLMPVALTGVLVGLALALARRLSPRVFYGLVKLGLLLTGVKLLMDAWR